MATLKLGTTTAITESGGVLTIPNITFPAGHVIQTAWGTKTGEDSTSMSSATFTKVVDSSGNNEWGADITGVVAGNDVIVSATWVSYITPNAANQGGSWGFFRGSTAIFQHTGGHANFQTNNDLWYETMTIQHLDINPGAGSHSYYLGCRKYGGSATLQVNSNLMPMHMCLQEIQR